MNLNFKTHFPWAGPDGQPEPTFFADKILIGLGGHSVDDAPEALAPLIGPNPKLHTIRRYAGPHPRIRAGMKLTMSTGSRFAPVRFAETTCTGVQTLLLEPLVHADGVTLMVRLLDDRGNDWRFTEGDMAKLAQNDGLTLSQFVRWFTLDVIQHGAGTYALVHWTDLRY